MRLPLTKVWRAFPELDPFSDEQCGSYARLAKRRRRVGWWVLTLTRVGLGVIAVPCGIAGLIAAYRLEDGRLSYAANKVATAIALAVGVAVPLVIMFLSRDMWLRRAIRAQLRSTTCRACAYQLIGLPVREGAIQCPECGQRFRLADFGMSPADFIATVA